MMSCECGILKTQIYENRNWNGLLPAVWERENQNDVVQGHKLAGIGKYYR